MQLENGINIIVITQINVRGIWGESLFDNCSLYQYAAQQCEITLNQQMIADLALWHGKTDIS